MQERIIEVADGFWNIRGSYKVRGLVEIGTHSSLVRRPDGRFLLLDAYTLTGYIARRVDELTGGPGNVEAVLNLHPFHTVHVKAVHERYPHARLYGTERHLARFSDLPWESLRTEDAGLHELFADEFAFSVPRGVDFISSNENLHFSSVLAMHRASKTIHVDDTVMYIRLPGLIRAFGPKDATSFHPTLGKVLERREGAVRDFRQWAEDLAADWGDAENLCTAHTAALLARKNTGPSIRDRLLKALEKVDSTLNAHQRKYG